MIGVIDYGLGNVQAFLNCYKDLNVDAEPVSDPNSLDRFSHIILPGVCSFDEAMTKLQQTNFDQAIRLSIHNGAHLMGVCVGMQVLADSSSEGTMLGLGIVPGRVLKFGDDNSELSMITPHMGWNEVLFDRTHPIFNGFSTASAEFYFLHSYFFSTKDSKDAMAHTNYKDDFCSAVNTGKVFGFQFHPEKSHGNGSLLLNNFSKMGF